MSQSHTSLVAELLQTRKVLQELVDMLCAMKTDRLLAGDWDRFDDALEAACNLLAVEPPSEPPVLAVLRELTEAVQTPKSGRRFFLAFKAALDLLETECQPVTEGAQKP